MKKNGLRLRILTQANFEQKFAAIITHPMYSGYERRPYGGKPRPADFIESIEVSVDHEVYIQYYLNENVSQNPFIAFKIPAPISDGQRLTLRWIDNKKRLTQYDTIVQFDDSGKFLFYSTQYEIDIKPLTNSQKPFCKTPILQN